MQHILCAAYQGGHLWGQQHRGTQSSKVLQSGTGKEIDIKNILDKSGINYELIHCKCRKACTLQCKCCKGSANSTGLHECEGHCSQEENGNMLNHEFLF